MPEVIIGVRLAVGSNGEISQVMSAGLKSLIVLSTKVDQCECVVSTKKSLSTPS